VNCNCGETVQQAAASLHFVTGCYNLKQAVRIPTICIFIFRDSYAFVSENFSICVQVHF
jgi:hypothetical protein